MEPTIESTIRAERSRNIRDLWQRHEEARNQRASAEKNLRPLIRILESMLEDAEWLELKTYSDHNWALTEEAGRRSVAAGDCRVAGDYLVEAMPIHASERARRMRGGIDIPGLP